MMRVQCVGLGQLPGCPRIRPDLPRIHHDDGQPPTGESRHDRYFITARRLQHHEGLGECRQPLTQGRVPRRIVRYAPVLLRGPDVYIQEVLRHIDADEPRTFHAPSL